MKMNQRRDHGHYNDREIVQEEALLSKLSPPRKQCDNWLRAISEQLVDHHVGDTPAVVILDSTGTLKYHVSKRKKITNTSSVRLDQRHIF